MGANKLLNSISLDRSKPTTSSIALTLPLTPCVHSDLHGEGGMFRLVIMDHNHIPAREGHPGSEIDLRLEKKMRRKLKRQLIIVKLKIHVRAEVAH